MSTLIFGHGGVGGALARILTKRGQGVHLVGRNVKALQELSNEINCKYSVCDVLQEQQIQQAVSEAGAGIQSLAYCVGSIDLKHLKSATTEDYLQSFRLNVLGAVLAAKYSAPSLAKNKGSIVLFSTVAVSQGFPSHSIIATAKFKGGVEGLTRSLAAEFAPDIRVNAIAPSLLKTPLAARLTSSETLVKSTSAMHPLQRLGEPEDAAYLAAFLLGPESTWITGQIIGVDGGRSSLRVKG